MASITGHLKTFARKSEPGHPEAVVVERATRHADPAREPDPATPACASSATSLPSSGHRPRGAARTSGLNLVGNALDAVAGQDAPWIGICARERHHRRDAVADNGYGISPAQIDRIFDPFFTTKPLGKGLGLGLSISYGIVQDFGGQIHAVNRPEGGAELTAELPRHQHETAAIEKALHA
jgi:C4-dicarboxylate-specific signal transduction histidine kinase